LIESLNLFFGAGLSKFFDSDAIDFSFAKVDDKSCVINLDEKVKILMVKKICFNY